MQERPKRCIFCSVTKSKIPNICEFQVERSNLPVSLPLLWPGTSTQNIYKTTEDPRFSNGEIECSVFLDDILLIASWLEELTLVQDSLIYLF